MTRSNRFQLLDALWASMNRIIAIAGKEFVALLKDKGSRFILVVPVIVQAVLFGYGATFNLERVPWTYYDASHSSSSMEVVRRITGTGIFELKAAPRSLGEFEETISSSTALLGLYFPPDFEKNGQVFAAADARNSTTAGVAMGYVNSIVAQINADRGRSSAFAVVERYRWNENGITRYAIIPSLTIMLSMLQVLLLSGLSVAREREEGSFDMMLMTPASSLEILAGKAVPPTIIACLQGARDFPDRAILVRTALRGFLPDARPFHRRHIAMLRWRGTRYFCLGEQHSAVHGDGDFLPAAVRYPFGTLHFDPCDARMAADSDAYQSPEACHCGASGDLLRKCRLR